MLERLFKRSREKARETFKISNIFIGDLVQGTHLVLMANQWAEEGRFKDPNYIAGFKRIGFSHILITLSKWSELYKSYKAIIPENCKEEAKKLVKTIQGRGIIEFRNKFIGHIWDKVLGKPLTLELLDQHLKKIGLDNEEEFLKWVNNPQDNSFPKTVVGIVEKIRDGLMEEFEFTAAELHP